MSEYSIIQCLRTDKPIKKNGKYPIYFRIRTAGKETKIPANIDVEESRWDSKKRVPYDKILQLQLGKKIADFELYINRLFAENKDVDVDLIREFFGGIKRTVKPESKSFFDYYINFVAKKVDDGINKETKRVYMTTYYALKSFVGKLKISDINLKFVEDFDKYMSDVKGNSQGGRQPKHKNLHTVILDILKHDIPMKDPYIFFKKPKALVKEVYLDRRELSDMESLLGVLERGSTICNVLEMYLFACYTGLRFSDIIDLKWANIDFGHMVIKKTMVKTKLQVITPVFEMAYNMIGYRSDDKKLYETEENIFARYSEPTVNTNLKFLAKMIGTEKHITFHTSRHTFATQLVQDKVDVFTISKYMGHKTIEMTMRYLKYDITIAADSAKEIKTFDSKDTEAQMKLS